MWVVVVVDNFYHSVDEYLREAKAAGFTVVQNTQVCFATEEERLQYNTERPPD